jgi:AcrR family transcriptional regulator
MRMTNASDQRAATSRETARIALLDAAERLLIDEGQAGITTRRLALEAGVNHGLVHYYFGSVEELLVQAMERFTDRLMARQEALYAADLPFLEKWRTAMGFIDEDLAGGYPKVWAELHALAWNHPQFRRRMAAVHRRWRRVFSRALAAAQDELALDALGVPQTALVALVATFQSGLLLERLIGLDEGHDELLAAIDAWLVSRSKERS